MATELNFDPLQTISVIHDLTIDSKLSHSLFELINDDLDKLAGYFGTTRQQAFLIANIFAMNYRGDYVDINDMGKYFDVNPVDFLHYKDDLNFLVDQKILCRKKSKHRMKLALANDQFSVAEYFSTAIVDSLPVQQPQSIVGISIYDVVEKYNELINLRSEEDLISRILFITVSELMRENESIPLIKKINSFDLEPADLCLLFSLIRELLNGGDIMKVSRVAENIFDDSVLKFGFMQSILNKQNRLIKLNFIEFDNGLFGNNVYVKLSEKPLGLLKAEGICLFDNKTKKDNIIESKDIGAKSLFFSKQELDKIEMVSKSLTDENLRLLQQRMAEKVMPTGIAVLLYGAPGTGKTESVYQMAKQTGRNIMRVEISQTKSMWFGESEKIVKKIFAEYEEYSKQCEKCPILFFNEADAVISKRREYITSTAGQTENTIQNILLEELEKFKGILFATTNIAGNFDKAFERRFLFKIEFCKPETQVRSQIWKSKLNMLSEEECKRLAEKFDFSGGQIDNIVRKCAISEVLNGSVPEIQHIITYCNEELLFKNEQKKIGYTNH